MSRAAGTPRPGGPRPALVAAGAALGLLAAFGAGRWTGGPPPGHGATPGGAAGGPVGEAGGSTPAAVPEVRPGPGPAGPAVAAAAPAPALAAAPPAQRTPLAPDVLARLRADVGASLEARRGEDLARCWPRDGLPRGQASVTVTYDLTFDPAGREVARGLSDDRRAPAGELARCLARSAGAPLAIAPQGTYVSLRLRVAYP